jgi:ribonuclease P protein component
MDSASQKKNYGTLKKSGEFRLLFKKGHSRVTHGFVCYFLEHNEQLNRLGIVASKKVGNAVERNRAKRIIREAFRISEPALREKTHKRYDFVFVARAKTPELKSTKIHELMWKIFTKL